MTSGTMWQPACTRNVRLSERAHNARTLENRRRDNRRHPQRSEERVMGLRVVLVDEELPYPPISGKRIRVLNLLRHLANDHRITILAHENAIPDEVPRAVAQLDSLGIRTNLVPPSRRIREVREHGPAFYFKLAKNLFSPVPFSAELHRCPNMLEAIRNLQRHEKVDVWQCEWAPYFNYLELAGVSPSFFMAHDIQTCIWQRYRDTEKNPLRRLFLSGQAEKYLQFEKHVFSRADLVATVTLDDARRAERMFSVRRPSIIDNGVDVPFYHPQDLDRNRQEILFLGSLDWPANQDAVRSLIDDILPSVRARFRDATLAIVGRSPPRWLERKIDQVEFAELHANVPDVRPYLQRCSLLAVPLRIGGGSRLKILEALASRTPVVSTTVGAEGLRLAADKHFFAASTVDQMADSIIDCLDNPLRAKRLAQAGYDATIRDYDWQKLASSMGEAWLKLQPVAGHRDGS